MTLVGSSPWAYRNRYIDIIPNLEFPGMQCDIVISASPPRAGLAKVFQPEATPPEVRVHRGKGEEGSFLPCLRVDLSDQRHQFPQGTVQPDVGVGVCR